MEDNMKVWNAVKQPPPSALKPIMGGRLKGKTDISPQWRYQVMTEQFGMCGTGWSYTVERVWREESPDGQVFAFAEILLYIGEGKPIPGVGGSMLVEKEASGLHASDEGYKMAITDALSVAMKMIGVGANIYAGLSGGSKYNSTQPAKAPPPTAQQQPPQPVSPKSEASTSDLSSLVFKDAGEVKTAMQKNLRISGAGINAATSGFDLTTEKGRADCWATVLGVTEVLDKGKHETT